MVSKSIVSSSATSHVPILKWFTLANKWMQPPSNCMLHISRGLLNISWPTTEAVWNLWTEGKSIIPSDSQSEQFVSLGRCSWTPANKYLQLFGLGLAGFKHGSATATATSRVGTPQSGHLKFIGPGLVGVAPCAGLYRHVFLYSMAFYGENQAS